MRIIIINKNGIDNCSDLEVDFGSQENASLVYAALAVDKEVNVLTFEHMFFSRKMI